MSTLLDVILPVFLVIAGGWAAARARLFSDDAVDALMRYSQSLAAPLLLFRSVATLDLAAVFDPALFLAYYAGAFAAFGAGFLGARHLFGRDLPDAVAIGFAACFSNSLLLGVPITERAYGSGALAGNFAIIAVHAPILYSFGITMMEAARARGAGLTPGRLGLQIGRSLGQQPLVIGLAAGFAVNLTGLTLPRVAAEAVAMIAATAIPTALFGLGGVLLRYRPEGDMRAIAWVVGCALLLHPGLTWGLGRALGLDVAQLRSGVLTAAMAPGVNAFLFANFYGVGKRVAASAVLLGTAGSILTVWVWLTVLP